LYDATICDVNKRKEKKKCKKPKKKNGDEMMRMMMEIGLIPSLIIWQ